MKHSAAAVVGLCLALQITPASAQTLTPYQIGADVAKRRGYADTDCYAKVFVKHAVFVRYASGKTGWSAASTPEYNNELRRRCGIDRLGDIWARAAGHSGGTPAAWPRGFPNERFETPRSRGGAYATGLVIARQRGHTGEAASCYARVFVAHASYRPNPNKSGVVGWVADIGPAFRGEMFNQCGISS